jgi:hypothetical protein
MLYFAKYRMIPKKGSRFLGKIMRWYIACWARGACEGAFW